MQFCKYFILVCSFKRKVTFQCWSVAVKNTCDCAAYCVLKETENFSISSEYVVVLEKSGNERRGKDTSINCVEGSRGHLAAMNVKQRASFGLFG